MKKYIFVLFIIVFTLCFAILSRADIIYLKNGRQIEGKIVNETGTSVKVEVTGGTIEINKSEVEKIERREIEPKEPPGAVPTVSEKETQNIETYSSKTTATKIVVKCFAINSKGHLFAGTSNHYDMAPKPDALINDGGVFRSIDNGQTWKRIGLECRYILSLGTDSKDCIFAGTDNGLFCTTDNGEMWHGVGPNKLFARHLAINSKDHIFAGTDNGLFCSVDNGATWNNVSPSGASISGIVINSNDNIFIATNQGVLLSTDNGKNWVNLGLKNIQPFFIFSANYQGHIFAGGYVAEKVSGGNTPVRRVEFQLFRSIDDGKSWDRLNIGMKGMISKIAFNKEGHIFCSMNEFFLKSMDNGETWHSSPWLHMIGYYPPIDIFAEINTLFINLKGDVIAGITGQDINGIIYSEDNGKNWSEAKVERAGKYISIEKLISDNSDPQWNRQVKLLRGKANDWLRVSQLHKKVDSKLIDALKEDGYALGLKFKAIAIETLGYLAENDNIKDETVIPFFLEAYKDERSIPLDQKGHMGRFSTISQVAEYALKTYNVKFEEKTQTQEKIKPPAGKSDIQKWREQVEEWKEASIKNKKVDPRFIEALENEDNSLGLDEGAMVILALGELAWNGIKDEAAIPYILIALKDNRELSFGIGFMMKYKTLSEVASYAASEYKINSAIPTLIKAVKYGSKEQRLSAIQTLGEVRNEEAIPILADFLKERKIGYRGGDSFMGYENREKYLEWNCERKFAVQALKEIIRKNEKSSNYRDILIPVLIEALGDLAGTSDEAEYALIDIGKTAIPTLITVIKDENAESKIHNSAANALRMIGMKQKENKDKYGIPAQHVPDIALALKGEKNEYGRSFLLMALDNIEDDSTMGSAVPALLSVLNDAQSFELKEKGKLNFKIFQILVKVKDEEALREAIPVVVEAVNGKYGETEKRDALKILANAGKYAAPYLIEIWKEDKGKMGNEVEIHIVKMGTSGAEVLIEMLKDPDIWIQKKATNLLLQLKDKNAVPVLIEGLDEENVSARKNIHFVLQKLTGRKFELNSKKWRDWWEKEKDIFEIRWQ